MAEPRHVPARSMPSDSGNLVATLARIARAVEEREAAVPRRTMTVVDGGKRGGETVLTIWIRRRPRGPLDELTLPWHILGEPNAAIQSERGLCGENLGTAIEEFRGPYEPDAGDRCPSCQGAHARGEA